LETFNYMPFKSCVVFILFVIGFSFKNQAQSNFLPAYVLKTEFDTLYGFVNNNDYSSNSRFCDFKASEKGTTSRYFPEGIYGYRFINGKYYISRNIGIDNKPRALFMEYLIKGRLDIYFYQDESGVNHYMASKDSFPLEELQYSKRIEEIDGKHVEVVSRGYAGYLRFFTSDCPEIMDNIKNLDEPDHMNLIAFAKKYHELTCKNEKCIIYEKKLPRKVKLSFYGGPVLGFSKPNLSIKSGDLCFGFNVLLQQLQRNERIYLGIGLIKESEVISSRYGSSLKLPVSINYLSPKQGFSPVYSYSVNLLTGTMDEEIDLGLNYRIYRTSFFGTAGLRTIFFVIPYAAFIKCGLQIDLNN